MRDQQLTIGVAGVSLQYKELAQNAAQRSHDTMEY